MPKLAIASDHAGYALKEHLKPLLEKLGWQYDDFGPHSSEPVDYPDYGFPVAEAVARGEYDRGILICGTGIGMACVANKVRGVRAALCTSPELAELSRRHNDTNVLTMGGRTTPFELAEKIVEVWLSTGFEGGRHKRRVDKIISYEKNCVRRKP
ncbi:MAG: ribose 5-phosphate isomerase B [Candidatus Latescibacterota bacterium]|nr:MAG: ribose 5-phosphate isomerase B [Candidatus Latescibacterota bacterium]RKY72970.1 MAG: ribose 5-phosphate isomerase B [Candidatus Latescibacterota bacterium]